MQACVRVSVSECVCWLCVRVLYLLDEVSLNGAAHGLGAAARNLHRRSLCYFQLVALCVLKDKKISAKNTHIIPLLCGVLLRVKTC